MQGKWQHGFVLGFKSIALLKPKSNPITLRYCGVVHAVPRASNLLPSFLPSAVFSLQGTVADL